LTRGSVWAVRWTWAELQPCDLSSYRPTGAVSVDQCLIGTFLRTTVAPAALCNLTVRRP
jgi:hypothetical protein